MDTDTQDTMDIVELTAHFGLPAHEQGAVLAWANATPDTIWTIAEADELAGMWAADTERILTEVN